MPLKFACPSCDKTLKASLKFAGKTFSCPQCGEKVRVPTPRTPGSVPSSGDLSGKAVAGTKQLAPNLTMPATQTAAQRPATQRPPTQRPTLSKPQAAQPKAKATGGAMAPGALPFDDDEWDEVLNPYESAKEVKELSPDEIERDRRKAKKKELRWARRGIKTVNGGLSAAGFGFLLSIVVYFLSGDDPGTVVTMLSFLSLILYGAGGIAMFVGPYLCLGTPADTGALFYAKLTCMAQTSIVILLGVIFSGGVTASSEMLGLTMFAFASGVTSYFAFVQYMVAMGKHLKRDEVVDSASMVMMLGVLEAIAYVLVFTLPMLAFEFTDYAGILLMAAGGAWLTASFGGLIAIFKYIAALEKLAKAL